MGIETTMVDHELHDLRGEIGGIRSDIRTLRDEVREGFSVMNGRVRKTEDALVESKARAAERRDLLASGQIIHVDRPSFHKDPRTYAVGGIGVAAATIIMEFLRTWGATAVK
jgi:hypothetical protein